MKNGKNISQADTDTSTATKMSTRWVMEECPELGRYVTPKEAKTKPIYDWFVYPHSFSPTLIRVLVQRLGLTRNDRILDPFVGAGTTILAAKEQGISAAGLDLLPISAALTQAKVVDYDLTRLQTDVQLIKYILQASQNTTRHKAVDTLIAMNQAPKSIIARAFDEGTLNQIIRIKVAIAQAASNSDNYNFMLVGLLALLERFSATEKSGGWLKIVERPQSFDPQQMTATFLANLDKMLKDVMLFQANKQCGSWSVKVGDARETHPELGRFKAVISSPPYLNRHDYTRVLSLELLVGFLDLYEDITTLRHTLLRSHVEAKPRLVPEDYKKPPKLVELLEQLKARGAEKRVLYIVDGYFEDMHTVLKASRQYLTADGYVAFVLGNVRFSGLAVLVDELIAEVGEAVGLTWHTTLVARRRNNSAQQMRDFGRDPSRESIVIWRAKN